ncbi:MAG: signal transduction protein [Cycloclasticus sp. symbiont of Bathymodiolus heckerae]|nr:MAG: signal transduction protein [Cycloclasticus sp. symbiont of Bathymodiolus heckerae]
MDKSSLTGQQYFLPDMCRASNVLYLTLVAQLLAIILALNTSFLSGDFWAALSLNALFILWVAFTCAAIFCAFKKRINNWPALQISLFMFLTINLATLLMTWLISSLLPQLELFSTPAEGSMSVYIRNTGISIIFSSILLRFLYIQFQWRKQTHAEAEARLDALQARIRPHFLFNSLNTIASLTRIDPPLAETLTEDLAELFRANMQASKRLVPFKQECTLVQQYLNIEQTRLGNRLTVTMDVSDIPDDALIPPLSIQPIIENAVYHGIEPAEKGGKLEITGRIEKNIITLLIKNPLDDTRASNNRPGNNMAIENIRLRMESCFPDQSTLLISASDLEFQTQLKFPYQTNLR